MYPTGGVGEGMVPEPAPHPMLDAVKSIPGITQPMLTFNSRHDLCLPYELSRQKNLSLLGTAEADKKLASFEAGHFDFPHNQMVVEIIDWLHR